MIHEAGEAVDASPLALRLIAFLDLALAEGWVEATGEKRSSARQIDIGVVVEERCQGLAQVPFDVKGKHAQKDMGAHTIGYPVPDRADLEFDGLHERKARSTRERSM
jgi:hypothetical protein